VLAGLCCEFGLGSENIRAKRRCFAEAGCLGGGLVYGGVARWWFGGGGVAVNIGWCWAYGLCRWLVGVGWVHSGA